MKLIGVASGDRHIIDGRVVWGGSGWARVAQYLPHLTGYEWVCGTLIWDKDRFMIQTEDEQTVEPDAVFMHRLMHRTLADHIKLARKEGQAVINDLDDWYWGLDTSNNAFLATHPKHNKQEDRYSYQSVLAASDLVIVSTPYLASRIRERINAPIVVVENTVDIERFKYHEPTDNTIPLVGWVGSTAHRSGDLETLRGVLGPLRRNNEIRLMHGGHHISYRSFAEAVGVEKSDIEVIMPLADQDGYPSMMIMDVGLVPLRIAPFNQAKSYIKGLEYSAAGIPFVAQSIEAYDDLRSKYGLGITVKKPLDWTKALRRLRDPIYRRDLSVASRELVQKRAISVGANEMDAVLSSVIS